MAQLSATALDRKNQTFLSIVNSSPHPRIKYLRRIAASFLALAALCSTGGSSYAQELPDEDARESERLGAVFAFTRLTSLSTSAGKVLCAPEACAARNPDPQILELGLGGVPTVHQLQLKPGLPFQFLTCVAVPDGAGQDCMIGRSPATAEALSQGTGSFAAEILTVPGDGCLYVSNFEPEQYWSHMKFCASRTSTLQVITPELQAVAMKSRTTTRIELKANPVGDSAVVTVIEKGKFVEIVAAKRGPRAEGDVDPDWYLLRDEFGLLGWAPGVTLVPACAMEETDPAPIERFCRTGA